MEREVSTEGWQLSIRGEAMECQAHTQFAVAAVLIVHWVEKNVK